MRRTIAITASLWLTSCGAGGGGAAASTPARAVPPIATERPPEPSADLAALLASLEAIHAAAPDARPQLVDALERATFADPRVEAARSSCAALHRAAVTINGAGPDARAAITALDTARSCRDALQRALVAEGVALQRVDAASIPTVDVVIRGELTDDDRRVEQDDSCYDDYAILVAKDWVIEIEMRSEDFDAYLWLLRDGEPLMQDDDGLGEGVNSRIAFTAPDNGTLTVRANSYSGGMRGTYELRIRAAPRADADATLVEPH